MPCQRAATAAFSATRARQPLGLDTQLARGVPSSWAIPDLTGRRTQRRVRHGKCPKGTRALGPGPRAQRAGRQGHALLGSPPCSCCWPACGRELARSGMARPAQGLPHPRQARASARRRVWVARQAKACRQTKGTASASTAGRSPTNGMPCAGRFGKQPQPRRASGSRTSLRRDFWPGRYGCRRAAP